MPLQLILEVLVPQHLGQPYTGLLGSLSRVHQTPGLSKAIALPPTSLIHQLISLSFWSSTWYQITFSPSLWSKRIKCLSICSLIKQPDDILSTLPTSHGLWSISQSPLPCIFTFSLSLNFLFVVSKPVPIPHFPKKGTANTSCNPVPPLPFFLTFQSNLLNSHPCQLLVPIFSPHISSHFHLASSPTPVKHTHELSNPRMILVLTLMNIFHF